MVEAVGSRSVGTEAVSVVGLGKLGACMAACMAWRGTKVLGVDVRKEIIHSIQEGKAPHYESRLGELIAASRGRLVATQDLRDAVCRSRATFLVLPTPSEPGGGFSLRFLEPALIESGRAIAEKPGYHLFVVSSTVLPGATRTILQGLLEGSSGKRCGRDFGLCYSPEFIALGSVIHDFLNPDFILIGESDEKAGRMLEDLYRTWVENDPPVLRMSFENAELAKLAVNTYVTMKISFANMLAEICERLPDGDVDTVTHALGRDSRIGPRFLKGGMGYGGPCFPRDNLAMSFLQKSLGCPDILPLATDRFNRRQVERIVALVQSKLPPEERVAVLGLSYKPNTTVVEESQGVAIAACLAALGRAVTVYDPLAMDTARGALGDTVTYAASVERALREVGGVVICQAMEELQTVDFSGMGRPEGPVLVVDGWRTLRDRLQGRPGIEYCALGLGMTETDFGPSDGLSSRLDESRSMKAVAL